MKKLLLLLPLLIACAPTMQTTTDSTDGTPATMIGPFKLGQQWSVSSDSKTDRLIPSKTVFTVKQVLPARSTVIGITAGGSDKFPIQIEYSANDVSFLLADISPLMVGAGNIRTCIFSKGAVEPGTFGGTAAHFSLGQVRTDPATFRAGYLKSNPAAGDAEVMAAFFQLVAPDDTGPCTLRLLN
ncbi:hypothetical protein [Deinococcus altitudinis]|uniref:hypothetical protein n=1 Tax=Deinococcus altitudinis TaxID=468914 RepID=UPI0038926844